MEPIIITRKKPVNQWMNWYISPGPVAPIGDVNINSTLKKSCPELAQRYSIDQDDYFRRGVGVQDGSWFNVHTGGLAARTQLTDFYGEPTENIQIGEQFVDLRPNDLSATTRELGAPQFGWKSTVARTFNARFIGEQFLPRPNGYSPSGGVSRGPQPRITTLIDSSNGYSGQSVNSTGTPYSIVTNPANTGMDPMNPNNNINYNGPNLSNPGNPTPNAGTSCVRRS
jgi:hypothetical protein